MTDIGTITNVIIVRLRHWRTGHTIKHVSLFLLVRLFIQGPAVILHMSHHRHSQAKQV